MNEILTGEEDEYRKVAVNMNQLTEQMTKLFSEMNESEGTVRRLIREDEIYIDLRDLVKDVKSHPWKLLKKS